MGDPIRIARIETFRLRAEVKGLPSSSLGTMQDRNGLLVRIEDPDGAFGWGEVWCNFPPHAGESRQQLLQTVIAPELIGKSFDRPGDVRPSLEERWTRMATHVGEPGPFGHCIAGIDMAMWDLRSRRNGQPLSALLGTDPADSIRVYASTLDPARAGALAAEFAAAGHNAFKLKVGHDPDRDRDLVGSVRESLGDGPAIMVDANQSWSPAEAGDCINRLAQYDLTFAEEPISALAPMADWVDLAKRTEVPLAAGENICGDAPYAEHMAAGALTVYQPDVAKWGGIGGCANVGRRAVEAGLVYCPHFMGTGIGLAASMHLLAAAGGPGFVELDSNANPLRTDLCDLDLTVSGGRLRVPTGHGIGVEPEQEAIQRYQATR